MYSTKAKNGSVDNCPRLFSGRRKLFLVEDSGYNGEEARNGFACDQGG